VQPLPAHEPDAQPGPAAGPAGADGQSGTQPTVDAPVDAGAGHPGAGEETPAGGKTSVRVEIDRLKAETVNVAEQQHIEYKQYLLGGEDVIGVKFFSTKHVVAVSFQEEEALADLYVPEEECITHCVEILNKRRVLVLTGGPDAGKGTTALYLGYKLADEHDSISKETFLVPPLARNLKIDLGEIIDDAKTFGKRSVIFKDAFARGNPDVNEFFAQLDKRVLGALTEKLCANEMFLIFTADSPSLINLHEHLSQLNIVEHLKPLKGELLEEGVSRKIRQFADSINKTPEQIDDVLGPAWRSTVVLSRQQLPQIARFIDDYLVEVLEGRIELEEALSRAGDLTYWLRTSLTESFEVWCFILTLGLSQCLPDSDGIAWFDFERLRKSISAHLSEELNLPDQQEAYLKEMLFDDFFLKRCHAETRKDEFTGEDVVRFVDGRYPEMLLGSLLKNNHQILAALLPHLKSLARGDDLRARVRAAQIIGRLGEVSPQQVTFATATQWLSSGEPRQQATVGYLYQGILSSHNARYRNECLKFLKSLGESDDTAKLWTAIATYKQIAANNLSLAMSELKNIVERRFSEKVEDAQRVLKILERIENVFRDRSPDEIDKINLAVYAELLREIVRRIFAQDAGILFAIQYTLVSMCLTLDPIRVFEELSLWMGQSRKSTSALIALLFLQEDGVAEELERRPVEIPLDETDGGATAACNPIVVSMISSEKSVRKLARFLVEVYEGFSTFFPVKYKRYPRKSFLMHLKLWAKSSLQVEKCRAAMKQLFVELLQSPNQELYKQIYNNLNNDPEFCHEGAELFDFANEVLISFSESSPRGF
jgi:hypothetical protein